MSAENRDDRDPLQSLIAEILEAENRGETIERPSLLTEHPEHADSLRDFFASHDRMKSAAEIDPPTLPPRDSALEDPTIPPQAATEDPTLAPTEPASADNVPTVGDQVRYFGDYELLEEIARGGMGVVFKARQMNLNRTVALKMILAGQFAGEEDVQRFYTEAEAAAQLDHPGIVPIFEIGEHAGQHYFSMGYIEGESLAHKVADGPLPPRESAELAKKICDAMAYAHERGVIHRDLKPANILIDKNGQPKVTDFGLAKKTGADSNLTGTGQILGTPAYMPPEQASGNAEVGPLADVYSLGAILYCLVTGRPPFQAANPMDTLLQVLDKEPIPPRQLNPTVPIDLETICLKCLHKDPKKRYSSSDDLSEELERFRNGEPILARPVGRTERGWRWCKRNPVIASLSALAATFLMAGTAVATYFAIEAQNEALIALKAKELAQEKQAEAISQTTLALAEKERADAERNKAVRQKLVAERRVYANQIASAYREWNANNAAGARKYMNDCRWDFRGWEHDYLNTLMTQSLVCRGHKRAVAYVGFTTDGSRVISCWPRKEWDPHTGDEIPLDQARFVIPSSAPSSTTSPDKSLIVNGKRDSQDGWTRYVDRHTGEDIFVVREPRRSYTRDVNEVSCLAANPHGNTIAVARRSGEIQILGKETGKLLRVLEGHLSRVFAVEFGPDGTSLVSGDLDGKVMIWDTDSGEVELTIGAHSGAARAVCFHPQKRRIFTAGDDNLIKCWDVRSGELQLTIGGHTAPVTTISVSSDGQRIASGSEDTTARTWNPDTGEQLSIHRGHLRSVVCVDISPSGSHLASGSEDTEVRIWDLLKPQDVIRQEQQIRIRGVAVSPDGSKLAINGDDGTIQMLDTATYKPIQTLAGHEDPRKIMKRGVADFSFSGDGKRLVSCGPFQGRGAVKVWDPNSGEELLSFDDHTVPPQAVAFSPDGTLIVGARKSRNQAKGEINVWEASSGKIETTIEFDENILSAIAFTPDGSRIVTASKTIQFWDRLSGDLLITLQHSLGRSLAHPISTDFAFSPKGDRIVSASWNSDLQIWDTHDGREILTLRGHLKPVTSVEYSADGSRIFSGSLDETVKVWDAELGTEILSLSGHNDGVEHLAISPSGDQLLSGSRDRTIRLWDASKSQEFRLLETLADELRTTFSDDGALFATFGDDTLLNVWSSNTGELLRSLSLEARSVAFDRRGRKIAASRWGGGGSLTVWDLDTGDEELVLPAAESQILSIDFSPSSDAIAYACDDTMAEVVDLKTGKTKFLLRGHRDGVTCVQYSRSGSRIATGSAGGRLRLWDGRTGKLLKLSTERDSAVTCLSFSDNDAVIVTGHEDGSINMWEIATGNSVTSVAKHEGKVTSVAFSPSSSQVVSSSVDRTVRVWDVQSGNELHTLQGHDDIVWAARFDESGAKVLSAATDSRAHLLMMEGVTGWCAFRKWSLDDSSTGAVVPTPASTVSSRRLIDESQLGPLPRETTIRPSKSGRLKTLGLALHYHHAAYRRLPPSKGSISGLSWRVHVLPWLDKTLYDEFKLDEPWDSDHNRKLIDRIPEIFAPGSKELKSEGKTRIVFPFHVAALYHNRNVGARFRDAADGLANTILAVVADEEQAVIWTRPQDLTINRDSPRTGWSEGVDGIVKVLLADGSVVRIPPDVSDEDVWDLLTRSNAEFADEAKKRQTDRVASDEQRTSLAAEFLKKYDAIDNQQRHAFAPQHTLLQEIIARQDGVFDAMLELRPDDTLLHIARGRDLAMQDRWKEAADAYRIGVVNTPYSDELYEYAAAAMLADRVEEYERSVESLAKLAGQGAQGGGEYPAARAASISTRQTVDRELAVQWAEAAAAKDPKGWFQHVAGLAKIRAGDLDGASEWIAKSQRTRWHPELNHLAMCLVQATRGELEEAKKYRRLVQLWIERTAKSRADGLHRSDASDWLELNALVRECDELLK